ncbi:MAG: NahK/ErcS family hybrid sensor histidine kinase/response regulator [Motiliproteus sp.]
MRKHFKPSQNPPSTPSDDTALIENLIGLGDFSARKNYYPELQHKIDELTLEKDRYKWLFENALHGIFQAEIDGTITSANPAIAAICGYESTDTLCASIEDIGYQLFNSHHDYQQLLKELLQEGKKLAFETQLKTPSGAAVDVSMNVLLKSRNPALIEAFVQDITERRKAQNSLTNLNATLEQRVNRRTKELRSANTQLRGEITDRQEIQLALQAAKQEAEQANQSKDKYLAAASHDLLQPLNAARLLVSTLQERQLAERDTTLVHRIHVALLGAEELLTDLLDISKLDANAITPDYREFAINDLLIALRTEFKPVAKKAGLRLTVVASQAIVHSDSRLLMRILRNLLSNAIRYTPKGRILLGCRRQQGRLRIIICDTGPGIPEDRQQDIFREFQQLENFVRGRDKGVGLGLAIVERISHMLEHPVRLSSVVGKGSCFSVIVPLSEQQSLVASNNQQPAMASDLTGARILVIDNEEAITHSMQVLLQEWGALTTAAEDTAQALYACRQQLPDIILADYHLEHDLTGLHVLDQIYADIGQLPPTIMITADRSDEVRQLFQQRGLVRLNKPVKPGKLRALISHMLNASQR